MFKRGKYLGESIRTQRYRMVRWTDTQDNNAAPIYELYDYKNDAKETKNIALEHPNIVSELTATLDKYPTAK